MKKNENGFPIFSDRPAPCLNMPESEERRNAENGECDDIPIAYVYAPIQKFCMLYSAPEALKHGTLFENLYKPMGVYGRE